MRNLLGALVALVLGSAVGVVTLRADRHGASTRGGRVVKMTHLVYEGNYRHFDTIGSLAAASSEVIVVQYVKQENSYRLPVDVKAGREVDREPV